MSSDAEVLAPEADAAEVPPCGVALHATGPLYLNAEYKFTSARPEIETADGQATVPARTHHWLIGVTAMF